MFYKLFDLQARRSTKEAVLFYIAYTAFALVLVQVFVFIASYVADQLGYEVMFSAYFGVEAVGIFCLGLMLVMLSKKKRLMHPSSIGYIAATIVCSLFGGAICGIIPCAVLATKKNIRSGR